MSMNSRRNFLTKSVAIPAAYAASRLSGVSMLDMDLIYPEATVSLAGRTLRPNTDDLATKPSATSTADNNAPVLRRWPQNADTSLPHGGVAHGIYLPAGVRTGNSIAAVHHRLCIRATHTGTWTGFEFHMRTPSPSDMGTTPEGAMTERWRSHPLSSYAAGNGGSYKVNVYKWNPDTQTMGELVGTSTSNYVHWPLDQVGNTVRENPYVGLNVPVVAGEFYIMELQNTTPPPNGKTRASSLSEAQAWGNNVGIMTINGAQRPDRHADEGIRTGAMGGEDLMRHWTSNDFIKWSEWTRESAMFQMSYGDGIHSGYIHAVYDNVSYDDPKIARNIGGNVMVRQRIPYTNPNGGTMPTRVFDKFEVYHGHHGPGGTPNSDLLVTIIVNGVAQATASYSPLPAMRILSNQGGNTRAQERRAMRIANLSQDVTLKDGDDVMYQYSASSSSANYRMFNMLITVISKAHDTRESQNNDTTIYAEVSTDGGSSWSKFASGAYAKDIYGMMYAKGLTYASGGYINGGTLVDQ